MTKNNPFSRNGYDLGVGDEYGYDIQQATENLLYQSANSQPCYVCGNTAHVRIIAKEPGYNNAQIQNGLYCCNHCIKTAPINPKQYGIREL